MTVMNRIALSITLGFVGIAASACTSPPLTNSEKQLVDTQAAYPITVEPQVATLVVKVDDGLQALGRGEDQRVRAFVEQWKSRGQGMLNAASPTGTPNQAAANAALGEIKKLLAVHGVGKGSVQYTSYKPAEGDNQAPITLSFVTYVANAAECGGNWSENLAFTPRNLPWPEFGCSTQHNFAAIVADPRDLIEPRTSDPADALRRGTVMEKYRAGMPTRTQDESDADSGRVSNVAPQ
jgi:pilus assembly protein CpaD